MNTFYFTKNDETFSTRKKANSIQIKSFKSIIDVMNSYFWFRGQGKTKTNAIKLAI